MMKQKHYYYGLGFCEDYKGKTSGSRVIFRNVREETSIELHKPHPSNVLKSYQINNLIKSLEKWSDVK